MSPIPIPWSSSRRGADAVPARWVIVDLETTGLNPRRDELLAIAAVAVRGTRVSVGDSFEIRVRPRVASARENILVHGIGAEAQLSAVDPAVACERFAGYVGDSPLAAFNAPFDREVLCRAMRAHGLRFPNRWLDIADLAPALLPKLSASTLDEWLAHLGIVPRRRHDAASDAFATASLFACLLERAPPAERGPGGLEAIARRFQAARQGG